MDKPVHLQTEKLAALLTVSRSFVETLDLQNILQATVEGVHQLIGLDTAAVYLLEEDILRLWATTPPLPPDFPDRLRTAPLADHPFIGKAISSGAPVLIADMRKEELTTAERSAMEQRKLSTVLFLPLIADVKAAGVLIVGTNGTPTSIPAEDVDLARTLANLAALAVKNASLYAATKDYADELEQTLADRQKAEDEREMLQARLAQAEKLESVGRLAGGVAHDFNNLLTVILGHAELALMRVGATDPVHAALLQIRTAGQRSARLTQQLLAFARQQTTMPRVLNLNDTVTVVLKMIRRLIGEDIDLVWRPSENIWAVRVDPVQVDQVLVNLCVNARDSITESGKLTIETENVSLDAQSCEGRPGFRPGEYVMLSVRDNGCGMNRRTLDRLFEPFFTTKEVGRGTGLGLATVYGIVKQNHGLIHIDSEPGRGTTVTVYLPRYEGDAERTERDLKLEPAMKGKETVLLVEDEPVLLNLTREMLEMQGYHVLAATMPQEALRLAREHAGEVQLLLTDVVMPQMNGRDLAEKLRSLFPRIKELFMSGYSAHVLAPHGVLEKGVHFIQKPFAMGDLAARIRETLDDSD